MTPDTITTGARIMATVSEIAEIRVHKFLDGHNGYVLVRDGFPLCAWWGTDLYPCSWPGCDVIDSSNRASTQWCHLADTVLDDWNWK